MEITNYNQLNFFIMADRMMNRGFFKKTIKYRLKSLIVGDEILDFLCYMRKSSYSIHGRDFNKRFGIFGGGIRLLQRIYYGYMYHKYALKLGFSIGVDVFDYGVRLTHYGTLVIGTNNRIGRYALIQPGTCIEGQGNIIGNNFYLATGARVVKKLQIADNVIVGANAVLNKSVETPSVMLAGIPAKVKGPWKAWYIGCEEEIRVSKIEQLKKKMGIVDDAKN